MTAIGALVSSRWARPPPKANSPRKVDVLTAQLVRPAAEGIDAGVIAIAEAMPRRASRWLSVISVCKPAICDWKPDTVDCNCPTLTASVALMPAATLVRRRSLPADPNDTVLATVLVEPEPIATAFAAVTVALVPSAAELVPVATAPSPNAALPFEAMAPAPTATEPVATAPVPIAIALTPVEDAFSPMASEPDWVACELAPIAMALLPDALAVGPLLLTFRYWLDVEMPATVAFSAATC